MTIEAKNIPGLMRKWLRAFIGVVLLFVVLVAGASSIVDVPMINGIALNQETGIGMAGLGYLFSKL